jgi:acetyl-CoA C-acetyltransferase
MHYIQGIGMTKFSIEDKNTMDFAQEAIKLALDDSGLSINDLDAVVVSNTDSRINGERQRHFNSFLSSFFRKNMPIIRVPAVCGGGGAALWSALRTDYDNVLVLGADKIATNTSQNVTDQILEAADKTYEQDEGMIFPAQNALVAQQHFLKYNSNEDDLALIALKNHEHAFLNPKAMFYKKNITLEKIKSSPIVASPLRLFDCSISVNGAAACIIGKKKSNVKICGSGLSVDYMTTFERKDMITWNATKKAAEDAYKQANVKPKDIDVAELHDAFTIVELISYEDLGFAEKGKGQELIRNGTVKLDGKMPINTSGGLKAKGHPISPTGISQIVEITEQLRGECKERQVSNAKIGLAQNIGGAGGTVSVHILEKC